MVKRRIGMGVVLVCAMALASWTGAAADSAKGPTIFAAASMKTALDAIAAAWQAQGKTPVVISYGSSGVLAKQISAGAPADLFISADQKWMDTLAAAKTIKTETRQDLLGNALVLVQPATGAVQLKIGPGFDLAGALGDGRLAVCTVSSCPAGIYGKEALEKLGAYKAVEPKLAQAENVRAALLLVSRGEAKLGIVYATDAKADPKVKVVDTFPEESHAPIVYPVAVTAASTNPDAAAFEAFLRSPAAAEILTKQGFTILHK